LWMVSELQQVHLLLTSLSLGELHKHYIVCTGATAAGIPCLLFGDVETAASFPTGWESCRVVTHFELIPSF
jgi:hypothetical protein